MNAAPWTKDGVFTAQPVEAVKAPWPVAEKTAWNNLTPTVEKPPAQADEEANKKLFGIELAKNNNPFEAASSLFNDLPIALWVSRNWANDPICLASRDLYLKTLELDVPVLDKKQLAAKVLKLAEEKTIDGTRYLVEAKDRIAGLRLYSDIMGYTGKVDIDASTKNITNKAMTVVFVSPDKKDEPKVINEIPNAKSEILNNETSPINIKLVG